MRIAKTLGAAGLAVLALVALPGVASGYFMDLPFNSEFTVANEGSVILKAGETEVTCQKVSGNGAFENKHTGSVEFLFKECLSAGTKCGTVISSTGEIETTRLPFHVVKVTHPENVGHPGILVTPKEGHFMSFKCAFGLVSAVVSGNGVIGTLTSPEVGIASNKFSFSFEADAENHQTHTTAHDTTEKVSTGTHYHLETSINGGGAINSAQIGKGSISFKAGEGTLTGE